MRTIALLTLATLFAAGAASAQDAAKAAAPARAKAPAHATVSILEPKNGAHVGQDVLVKFGAKNISVAPATDTAPGTGHHHLLIDAKELPPLAGNDVFPGTLVLRKLNCASPEIFCCPNPSAFCA